MRNFQTEGIVLNKHNYAESDQFVSFFTRDFGKIDAATKGARKLNSHFIGHIETFNICKLQFYKNNNNHYTLIQCQTIDSLKNLKSDLSKTLLAYLVTEIFNKNSHELENTEMYNLLQSTLTQIDQGSNDQLCVESFKIKFLQQIGSLPNVANCSVCSKRWSESAEIILDHEGHITCNDCKHLNHLHYKIDFRTIKLINYVLINDYPIIEKVHPEHYDLVNLKAFADTFLKHFSDRETVSENLLNRIF